MIPAYYNVSANYIGWLKTSEPQLWSSGFGALLDFFPRLLPPVRSLIALPCGTVSLNLVPDHRASTNKQVYAPEGLGRATWTFFSPAEVPIFARGPVTLQICKKWSCEQTTFGARSRNFSDLNSLRKCSSGSIFGSGGMSKYRNKLNLTFVFLACKSIFLFGLH